MSADELPPKKAQRKLVVQLSKAKEALVKQRLASPPAQKLHAEFTAQDDLHSDHVLVLANIGLDSGATADVVRKVVHDTCGLDVDDVHLPLGQNYTCISFRRAAHAHQAVKSLDGVYLASLTRMTAALLPGPALNWLPDSFAKSVALDSTQHIVPPGAIYVPEFVTEQEEADIAARCSCQPFELLQTRQVSHYGNIYNLRTFDIVDFRPLPDFVGGLLRRLANHAKTKDFRQPTQLTINKYTPGHGIPPHVDEPCVFGPEIFIVSLLSQAVIEFSPPEGAGHLPCSVLLEPRSLLVLSGDARYVWKHAVPSRKSDVVNGVPVQRRLRFSLTFRSENIGQRPAAPDPSAEPQDAVCKSQNGNS